ncbi:hypothetical protein BBJ28_00011577 [Nothophytophthora sp. Chile5]|nr:hypothetical protein BBJ28_00011577 [Nothophytophthora sp. Chile5]
MAVELTDGVQIIQDLVLASNRNSRVQSRREGELETSEKKNEETRRALETAKADIQRLKQQLKVSEHRVKAKEVLVERMQAKLQQQVDKETMSKTRDRRAFRNLQQRDPRRANPRDSQSLETIGVYEAQREQMQEELEHLKTQVAALNSELRDKDNYMARRGEEARKAELPVWDDYADEGSLDRASGTQPRSRRGRYHKSPSVGSDDMMLEQLEAARREQELAAAKLRHREAAMIKKVAMIEQELLTAREMIGELKEENANLTLEAESRPSIRDYRLGQRRIHQLERQVAENKLALEEASDLNELRKYMGTKELVERDRLNHRLHLNRLNTLPRETTLEIVKHVCRVLHLTDITLIAPSLDKLCSVVAAVPRMEKFIRDVCGFVFLHVNDDLDAKDAGKATFELEQVLPTLQQWTVERRKLYALEGFKASVVTELCKRSVEPSILSDKEDSKQCDGPPSQPTSLSRAVHIVAELVELEKNVLQHREIYSQAAAELERRPSVLINQIVRHFSHLFQVKSIEGVLPKVNRYPNADGQEENVHSDNVPNFVVDKRRAQDGGRVSSQTDLVGVRQVREMTVLVRELKRELGAATMEEILPRTKRLMELLSLSIHNTDPEEEGGREYA